MDISFWRQRAAALLVLGCLGSPVWSQSALALAEAQQLAVNRSRQLTASDAAAASVRELTVAAGQLPDPVLKLGLDNVPVSGPDRLSLTRDFMTMRRIGVMQEFTGADKRRLRGERLGRDLTRIQAERALAIAVIRRDTALAWLDRFYAQALVALLQTQVAETRLQIEGAEIAYRTGRGTPSDAFAARAALASLQDRLRLAERQAQSAVLMLARWIGADAASRPLAGPANWREDTAAQAGSVDSHTEHPQLKVLEAQALAADTDLRLAQAETRPDWTFEAAFQQRGPQFSNMASIGVSIPLQFDRANRQDRVTAARLEAVSQARAKLEDAEQAHEAELDVAYNDWNTGRERITRLSAELLPAAAQRTQASLIDYRTGKGSLPAALAARREEIDARIQLLALEQETARQWVLLDYLMTSVPETQP